MARTIRTLAGPCALLCLILLLPVFAAAASSEKPLKLTILYMNDPHAHYLPYKIADEQGPIGGFAKAQTVIEQVRARCIAEGRDTLTLMAGDLLMGTPFSTVFKGELGVRLMNCMKFDAMAVGNHEFDYGLPNLLDNMRQRMSFPLLSANIRTEDGRCVLKRLIVRNGNQGTKIVIFGLTTQWTPSMTLTRNVKGLVFEDPTAVARALLRHFKDEDLIIALTHVGVEVDRKLARACPGIDVIIGGHSHTRIAVPEKVGSTLICQAGAYAKYVGRLDLVADRGRVASSQGKLIFLGPSVKADPKVASIIQSYQAKMDKRFGKAAGRTDVFLDGSRRGVRSDKETNLGKLVAFIMAHSVNADVGLVNGGAIRGSLSQGNITVGDVYTVLPFQDTVVKVTLTGGILRGVLQRSLKLPLGSGGKLHTYGLTYAVRDGKLKTLKVRGQPFSPEKHYSAAINNFLATGGDGYGIFQRKGRDMQDTRLIPSDLFIDYLQKHQVLTRQMLEGLGIGE
jgi:5'-nucleotidase/UDP-sugar diphosphatase